LYLVFGIGSLRLIVRLREELSHSFFKKDKKNLTKILLLGAGSTGEIFLREFLRNSGKVLPVGFLDSDEEKQNKTIHG